jgi:membrane protease YdiL (CAAX protease family)
VESPAQNDRLVRISWPKIRGLDIFIIAARGMIGAAIVVLLAKSGHASPLSVALLAVTVNGLCWIGGYQGLHASRGWDGVSRRFSSTRGKILLAGFAGAVGLIVLATAVSQILTWSGVIMAPLPTNSVLTGKLAQLPLVLLVVAVVGPLAEELMFRGLLLDWLRQKMPAVPAAVTISLIFALLHNNGLRSGATGWLVLGDRFLLGLATSFLALRYRTLLPGFVMHSSNNCLAIVFFAITHQSR